MPGIDDGFYTGLPVFEGFGRVMDPAHYQPLPADWTIGFADVSGSTKALAEGRYKAVNMVGAGVIAAISNALERRAFPYSFGGDGASFAVAPADAAAAESALQAMAVFAREELQLELRVASCSLAAIRAAGREVLVARFAPSPHTSYAMFGGGGLAWLEAQVKAGTSHLPPAPAGTRPNLDGLSCRWKIAPAAQGVILSVIVVPRTEDHEQFRALVEEIIAMADAAHGSGRPITLASLKPEWPGKGLALEVAATATPGQSRLRRRVALLVQTLLATIYLKFKIRDKNFDAVTYTGDVAANADFRKFDDGLKMTLDCTPALADALEARLHAAGDIAVHGTFRQTEALMTCFVPAITDRGHVHFVDGAGGGYALAAQALKARLAG